MPKDNSERIIDWPYSPTKSRSGTVSGGGGGGGGGGATNLDGLTDVTVSAPANGQVLAYDSGTGQWVNSSSAGGGMTAHTLSGAFHTGLLNWNLINFSGSLLSDIATRPHSVLTGMTPNDHHPHVHPLIGADSLGLFQHTATGLTAGQTIRAISPTGFVWSFLDHTDLNPASITANQHHFRVHDIITGDPTGVVHTITGSQFQVVGATATNTIGLLTPSSNPGAAAAILRTDSAGALLLDTNLLYVDATSNRVGINRTPLGAALDIQVSALADHTQRIKQVSGQSGRMWRVEDIAGNELIVLDSVGNLQSGQPGFVSGLTGWQISYLGNAEFNNIWARGELHATVFVKDEVHATGGTLLVATAGKLHKQAAIDLTGDGEPLEIESSVPGATGPLTITTTSGTFSGTTLDIQAILNYLEIDDPPSGPGFYFTAGDVIRSKTEVTTGVTDFWLEVNNAKQFTGYSRYSVQKRSGTDGVLPAGSAVVSYGKPGDGRILLTSDLNYAPYLDVFNVGPNVWTGAAGSIIPRVRLGRLDGVGVVGVSGVEQYGIVAGTDLSNTNAPYFVASNLQMKLYKINITLNDGVNDTAQINQNGSLTLGSNIGVTDGKSFQVINGTGDIAEDGNVIIGRETGPSPNYVKWNNDTGVLSIVGSVTVTGGTVTKEYVDVQDNNVKGLAATDASAKSSQALTSANSYSSNRRVNAVAGTWTVTGPAAMSWVGATVTLGGVASNIGPVPGTGAFTGLSALFPTFLYIDVTQTPPFTLQQTTNTSVLSASNAVLAVFNPGTIMGSITMVAGTTYISGSNIITGTVTADRIVAHSITANEIAGLTITANEIAATTITAAKIATHTITANEIAATTITANEIAANAITSVKILAGAVTANKITVDGNIAISSGGAITGGGKAYGAGGGSGFYLGTTGTTGRFDVGNDANFLRWDGTNFSIRTEYQMVFAPTGGNHDFFQFNQGGQSGLLSFNNSGVADLNFSGPFFAAGNVFCGGNTFTISGTRSIGSSGTAGNQGEICWDNSYLYLRIPSGWRRISLGAAFLP